MTNTSYQFLMEDWQLNELPPGLVRTNWSSSNRVCKVSKRMTDCMEQILCHQIYFTFNFFRDKLENDEIFLFKDMHDHFIELKEK